MYLLFVCNNNELLILFNIFKNIIKTIQIIAPILLIIALAIKFIKLTLDVDNKKLKKQLFNSIMALVIIFFIPLFVDVTMNLIGEETTITSCWNNSNIANSKAEYIELSDKERKKISDYEKYESGEKRDNNNNNTNDNVSTSASGSAKIDKAVNWAIQIANDNTYGYNNTYGNSDGQNKQYNCICYVMNALRYGGINVNGVSNVVGLPASLTQSGFSDVTSSVNLATGSGLKKGDVVWTSYNSEHGHVELYVGDGKLAGARSDNDGVPGDSSGSEISVSSYFNLPWKKVFRYNK